jgi:acetyl esterase/lipase
LERAFEQHLGDNAVGSFLRRSPTDGPERYAAASPHRLLPLGIPQAIVHGSDDEAVPIEMSRAYAAAAEELGDSVSLYELDGVDHLSLIDPRSPAWTTTLAEIRRFGGSAAADS